MKKLIKAAALSAVFAVILCCIPAFASDKITLDIFAYAKDNSQTYIAENVEVDYTASPLALLKKYCDENDIVYVIKGSYLESIKEYKAKGVSGWLHLINGEDPKTSAAHETLKPGDKLVWFFAATKAQWPSAVSEGEVSSAAVSSVSPETSAPVSSVASSLTPESKILSSAAASEPSEAVSSEAVSSQSREPDRDISGLFNKELEEITQKQADYIRKSPGTWTAFALGAFGRDIPNSVKKSIKSELKNAEKITSVFDCQRLYFNARAAELDTSAIYKKATDENKIENATLNALIFGVRIKYAETGSRELFTEKQRKYFLSAQKPDGSFALTENFDGDIDVTAMAAAVLSLSEETELTAAKDRALDWLKSSTPEFSESAAQMLITGVTARDRELCESALAALLTYKNSDGGFAHIAGGESDTTATEQALIALSSLKHEMSPYYRGIKPPLKAPDYTPLWIILSIVLAALIAVTVFIVVRKRKDK